MIDVQELYLLRQDFIRKDHSGWISGNEYNRRLALAQKILMEYHVDHIKDKTSQEALKPFYATKRLPPDGSGFYTFPSDYERYIDFFVAPTEQCSVAGSFSSVHIPAKNELIMTNSSSIRSKEYRGELFSNKIKIYGTPVAQVHLNYYSTPPVATRAFTINSSDQIEEYDSGNSVDLEWSSFEQQDFLDILLLFDGITLRDSGVMQWLQMKKPVENLITSS